MIPTAKDVAHRAEYEVDEALAEAPVEVMECLDVKTRRLCRALMIMSWERGAAWVVEAIAKV